jgi:hypothetical protein
MTSAGLAATKLITLELDHVVIAVADLAAAAHEFEARYGLTSIEGGRHAGWGTANRIVPLGETYLELVAVVDEEKAAQSAFGRWVGGVGAKLAHPLGWAVRTDDIDTVARRLDLEVGAGSRPAGGGRLLRWRLAGLERAAGEPSLPFFMEWGEETPFPGRAPVTHRAGSVRIAELRLAGDPDRLAGWLGPHRLPIAIRAGAPAVTSVVVRGTGGEIVV